MAASAHHGIAEVKPGESQRSCHEPHESAPPRALRPPFALGRFRRGVPTCYQGTQLRSGAIPILDLQPPEEVGRQRQRDSLDLLQMFNREHSQRNPTHPDLEARMASYELAFRMQTEVPGRVGNQPY